MSNNTQATLEVPSAAMLTDKLLFEDTASEQHQETERRLKLIRMVSLIVAAFVGVGAVSNFVSGLLDGESTMVIQGFLALGNVLLVLLAWWLARKGASATTAKVAAYIILVSVLIVITIFRVTNGVSISSTGAYFATMIAVCLLDLSMVDNIIIGSLALIAMVTTHALDRGWHIYTPAVDMTRQFPWVDLFLSCSCLVAVLVGIGLFIRRSQKTLQASQAQTRLLRDVLLTLKSSTTLGSTLSRELAEVTAELDSTSREQAGNTQEQVAAVTQVTASLEELSETANQIAGSADSAAASAGAALSLANTVRQASHLAQEVADQGNDSVQQAIANVERVRDRIEQMGQRLLNLTEQNRRVSSIIDIIDEIADETHLLALNASIEAAGQIGSHENVSPDRSTNRADRFGVIAQEIKNLSDRSRESTEEVRQAISEMQGAVAAAVLVAEEGKKESAMALSRSQISGAVIEKLNGVVANSARQAEQILEAVEEVNLRCDEIRLATSQQRTANQQILNTMRNVAQVAQENVGSVSQLNNTVGRLNHRLDELNQILTRNSSEVGTAWPPTDARVTAN